jgi:Tfp pilus assembly ATPase PilU
MELMPIPVADGPPPASDLIFSVGAPPGIKINGETTQLGELPVDSGQVQASARAVMSEAAADASSTQTLEMNLALAPKGIGRFPRQPLPAARRDRDRDPLHHPAHPEHRAAQPARRS